MKYRELANCACKKLTKAGIDEAMYEVRSILQYTFNISLNDLVFMYDEDISSMDLEKIALFNDYIEKRIKRYPWQYIINEQNFCGIDFYINENVLIPRFDTENLVELVCNDYKNVDKKNIKLLDMCCGSGCIGISLCKLGGFTNIDFVDVSGKAIDVTKRNVDRLIEDKTNINIIQSNMFSLMKDSIYDIIVCNPPYIETKEIDFLMPEVRLFEPKIALDGKEDGMYFYKEIRKHIEKFLNQKGILYMEIGCDQTQKIKELFGDFGNVEIFKDLSKLDRIVKVYR